MKSVSLSLSKSDGPQLVAQANFADEDIALLSHYISFVNRLDESTLLARGIPEIKNITMSRENGLVIVCDSYTNTELYEILHLLRPLILQDEKTSFYKISALINNRFRNEHVGRHIKYLRRIFNDGELSRYIQLTVAKQPIFDESFLKLWLNAEQYHADPEKIAAWEPVKNSLRLDNERAIIVSMLRSKVKAIHNLAHIAELVTGAHAA